METIILHPKSKEQIKLIEQLAKALKMPFEIKKVLKGKELEEDNLYGEGFKASVLNGLKAYENGEFIEIQTEDLWK